MDTTSPLIPSSTVMLAHLRHLFGGDLGGHHEGLIELAWNRSDERAVNQAQLYGTDQLELLAEHAARTNAIPGCNVFVGAALRKPGTKRHGRAKDADFLALTAAYVDLDKEGTVKGARAKYGSVRPTLVVVTGQVPDPRAQLWWRLDDPIADPTAAQGLLKGMAAKLDGDPTVSNPARVMRLAGSIAWPVKAGRVLEATELLQPGPMIHYLGDQLVRTFPPIGGPAAVKLEKEQPGNPGITRQPDAFGLPGLVTEGREKDMRDMVHVAVLNWYRENPIKPNETESLQRAMAEYEVYERKVGPKVDHPGLTKREALEAEKRGFSEWLTKWQYQMAQWDTEVAEKAGVPNPNASGPPNTGFTGPTIAAAAQQAKATGNVYEYLTVEEILALPEPRWVIDKLVIEQGLGFIYGPPGSLKTFMALDIALTLATKQPNWWGYPVNHSGAVVYILAEGVLNLPNRMLAWERHRGVSIAKAPFRLIRETINFMKVDDIGKLLNTVQKITDESGPIAALFVDTVSRMLPGAKENQQEDMTLFIAACDAVRKRFFATVFGLHHTNYAGGIRGSTVIPGAGDFLIEAKREPGAMTGSILVKKVKDGEDGWERNFKVAKVPVGDIGLRTSLVIDGIDDHPAATGDGLPSKDICRQILAAIDEQWGKGTPWCFSKNSPRCAETNISKRWNIERKTVRRLLEHWNANAVIEEMDLVTKKRVKGYRKMVDI